MKSRQWENKSDRTYSLYCCSKSHPNNNDITSTVNTVIFFFPIDFGRYTKNVKMKKGILTLVSLYKHIWCIQTSANIYNFPSKCQIGLYCNAFRIKDTKHVTFVSLTDVDNRTRKAKHIHETSNGNSKKNRIPSIGLKLDSLKMKKKN